MAGPGGGRTVVDQPRRVAPQTTLLDLATLVPASPTSPGYAAGPNGALREHWLNGITYQPDPCGPGAAQYVGCGKSLNKPGETGPVIVARDPFLIYREVHCSAIGWESQDYVGRATRALAATEAFDVESEFWTGTQAKAGILDGVDYSLDNWVASLGASVITTGPLKPVAAIARIHDTIGALYGGGQAFIHVPAGTMDHLAQGLGIVYRNGNTYSDVKGNVVVPGYGYTGSDRNGNAAAAGSAWIYVTGAVRYWRTDVIVTPGTISEALDRTANTISFRAERYYLVDYEPCPHLAVQVDIT